MAGYTPLFSRIVSSSIWSEDSDTRVVWVTMLAMADSTGFVEGTPPGLARFANVSREACDKALNKFLSPDPDSRTKDCEGKRIEIISGGWRLLNHKKHRDEAKSRAEYYRKYRKKFPPIPSSKEEKQTTNNILQTAQQHCNNQNVAQPLQNRRNYTEKEVQDLCWQFPPDAWRIYYDHFNAQGWIRANGQPIINLASHINRMWDKANRRWVFEKVEEIDPKNKTRKQISEEMDSILDRITDEPRKSQRII